MTAPTAEELLAHPLIENATRQTKTLLAATGSPDTVAKVILLANISLIARHPDLFADPSLYMTAPVTELPDGTIATAQQMHFTTEWRFEAAGSVEPDAEDREAEILAKLGDDLATELRAEIARNPGKRFCPYVPVITSGLMVDPVRMEPVVRFTSRFALV